MTACLVLRKFKRTRKKGAKIILFLISFGLIVDFYEFVWSKGAWVELKDSWLSGITELNSAL